MIARPIIIVDDDKDDQEIIEETIRSIGIENEIKFFDDCRKVLDYLSTTKDQPFVIISDINLPIMSGLELRERIEKDPYLKDKSIPFIFLSTAASHIAIRDAYRLTVQGFFQKPASIVELQNMIRTIFTYWEICRHPNDPK